MSNKNTLGYYWIINHDMIFDTNLIYYCVVKDHMPNQTRKSIMKLMIIIFLFCSVSSLELSKVNCTALLKSGIGQF